MDSRQPAWVAALESAWSEPNGALYRIREGQFKAAELDALLGLLEEIKGAKVRIFERRLVSLLWYLPIFLSWQTERIKELGGNAAEYGRVADRMLELISEILGVP